jgi:hypothetical protein
VTHLEIEAGGEAQCLAPEIEQPIIRREAAKLAGYFSTGTHNRCGFGMWKLYTFLLLTKPPSITLAIPGMNSWR